jgi:gas vesicle protein
MGQNTEELTTTPADIEATRSELTRDIDELTDKVSPARVLDRRKEAARGRMGSIRDKVMGTASGTGNKLGGTASSATGSVSDTASGALEGIESRTQGNPLAAGLVAFGAGMLISALIPASEKEAQAAQRLTEVAKEHGQPVIDEAKSVGQDVADDLKQSAADSAQQVKSTAQESVDTVKQEGQSSAQNVKDDATPPQ